MSESGVGVAAGGYQSVPEGAGGAEAGLEGPEGAGGAEAGLEGPEGAEAGLEASGSVQGGNRGVQGGNRGVPKGRMSTLGGREGVGSNEETHEPVSRLWPMSKISSGRQAHLLATAANSKLPPLKCSAWEFTPNPEFNRLILTPKSGTAKTVEKWRNYFSVLGRAVDVIVKTDEFSVRLHQPLCTYGDKYIFELHYLPERVKLRQRTR
jgi:hypothetical protein